MMNSRFNVNRQPMGGIGGGGVTPAQGQAGGASQAFAGGDGGQMGQGSPQWQRIMDQYLYERDQRQRGGGGMYAPSGGAGMAGSSIGGGGGGMHYMTPPGYAQSGGGGFNGVNQGSPSMPFSGMSIDPAMMHLFNVAR